MRSFSVDGQPPSASTNSGQTGLAVAFRPRNNRPKSKTGAFAPAPNSLTHHSLTSSLRLRIQKLRKPRIFGDGLKVRVGPGLQPVLAIQPYRLTQLLDALLRISRHARQQREPIERIVRRLILRENLLELLPRILILPLVQQ